MAFQDGTISPSLIFHKGLQNSEDSYTNNNNYLK